MAAPSYSLLASITRRCRGSAVTVAWRQNPYSRSLQHAKPLQTSASSRAKSDDPDPVLEGAEYIPSRKTKSPMRKVAYAWLFGFPSGIILFLLAKMEVDKRRLDQLKVRQRMKNSNRGEYESERFKSSS
uniref:Uncharacterized protein n=1 Tax=Leptobrachium leishanense TaxID=445787 RepID=A0A8C5QVI0_9ANUR